MARRFVKITDARNDKRGLPTTDPDVKPSALAHRVWVGNDEEGWAEIPDVGHVTIESPVNNFRSAKITVWYPIIQLEAKPFGN